MQKTGIIVLGSVAAMLPALAQASETVRLAEPDLAMEGSLMTALKNRHSTREYAAKDLTGADLSNLLWATAGVNRPDGRRTAPTALNLQEIGVYVVTAKGAFSYRHEGHELVKLTDKNLMPLVAMQQDFVNTAPLALVYVGDLTKLPGERGAQMAAVDAGIAVQNALLYCSAAGLACVPRATMNVCTGALAPEGSRADHERRGRHAEVGRAPPSSMQGGLGKGTEKGPHIMSICGPFPCVLGMGTF